MCKIKLRDYQESAEQSVLSKFTEKRKVLLQLATGAGKTVVFSHIAAHFKKVCILVHREELVQQTIDTLNMLDVWNCDKIVANKRKINHNADVYVCMVETVYNRIKKGKFSLDNMDLVIADECHRMDFNKVLNQANCKILGVTATPVIQKRETFYRCRRCKTEYTQAIECCGDVVDEWTRPVSMSRYYEDIVVGVSIQELINRGSLCKDICLVETVKKIDNLVESERNADGYSDDSINDVFGDSSTMFDVYKNYEQYCKGKKTLIFNANTKINKNLYKIFQENNTNCKMYDSVNNSKSEREDVVEWFKNERDAVLLNVGVFTTGFDVKDVECIILNKATRSLSLYLQIVGRGARITDKIYKDSFLVIDGGGNIDRFQKWSSERDWKSIFYGDDLAKQKIKKEDILDVTECVECGALIPKTSTICEFCGALQVKEDKERDITTRDTVLVPVSEIPYPDGEKIYNYTKLRNENINFAFKIMINQIVDLFRMHGVTVETWNGRCRKGNRKRVEKMVRSVYFKLVKKSDIWTKTGRKLDTIIDMTIKSIDNFYS